MARNVWLVLTYTFFGPLVGAATFVLIAIAVDPILTRPGDASVFGMINDWPIVLTTCYVLGTAPAFVSAILQIIATRWLPTRRERLIAAPILGALVSIILLGLFFLSSGFGVGSDWWVFALLGITGGVAALVSLWLVELFHKLPKPA